MNKEHIDFLKGRFEKQHHYFLVHVETCFFLNRFILKLIYLSLTVLVLHAEDKK